MRTSYCQYVIMVEFMEKNGDLSKLSGGAKGRLCTQSKWKELILKLNSESTGACRSEEKWRKVWSDLKINTKKKWAKIRKDASATGGESTVELTMIESRVMKIIGEQAAIGMPSGETCPKKIDIVENMDSSLQTQRLETVLIPELATMETLIEGRSVTMTRASGSKYRKIKETKNEEDSVFYRDWNDPGTLRQPKVEVTTPPAQVRSPPVDVFEPPPRKRQIMESKIEDVSQFLIESIRQAWENVRLQNEMFERLETERLRQRDRELQLQTQWIQLFKQGLNVFARWLDQKEKD